MGDQDQGQTTLVKILEKFFDLLGVFLIQRGSRFVDQQDLRIKYQGPCDRDTLLLAEELAPVPSPLYWVPEGAEQNKPQLEIAIDEDTLSSILAESAEDVQSLLAALQ